MLKKRDRLTVEDIEALSKGTSVFSTLISLRYIKASKSKFAVSVSKKIAKTAVDRNRIRRRVYSMLDQITPLLKESVHAMLMPKKEFLNEDYVKLGAEITALFQKARLI
jgi:ribonuclease P protein component